jgi:cell division transport system permease protein
MRAFKEILPRGGKAGGLLALAIGVMVYLASMALTGGIAITMTAYDWQSDLNGNLTVKIEKLDGRNMEKDLAEVLEILKTTPGIKNVRALTQSDVNALIAPWLGDAVGLAELELPQLIDLRLDDRFVLDRARLSRQLHDVAEGIQLDDHGQWRDVLDALALTIQLVALAIVLLIMVASVAVVVFATRADLATHANTVTVLHLVGARDKFIAREFQRYFMRIGMKGGLLGLWLSVATLFGFAQLAQVVDQAFLTALAPSTLSYLALMPMPIAVIFLAMNTARSTVLSTLSTVM